MVTQTAEHDLLTRDELLERLSISRATLYNMMVRSGFPRPIKLGGLRENRWYRHEVDAWLDAQPRAAIQVREEEPDMT